MIKPEESRMPSVTRWAKAVRLPVFAAVLLVATMLLAMISGCSTEQPSQPDDPQPQLEEQEPLASLEGKDLLIYCDQDLSDPFQEVVDSFSEQTGCTVNVEYGDAAQIQTQIASTEEGDFFIAGAEEDLDPIGDYVVQTTPLVKHVPVLVVPMHPSKSVRGLADLATCDSVLIDDPDSTRIGAIARDALVDAGLWDSLSGSSVLSTGTPATQIALALANEECDAGIVWSESVDCCRSKVVEDPIMDNYVKTVPAALLACSKDAEAANEFNTFLHTITVDRIWKKHVYDLA